jgi:excisionase family DNA binding protein
MKQRTALYRCHDERGDLLYVGISIGALGRLAEHQRTSHWFDYIATVSVEWFSTRLEAEAAERAAIRTEKPRFNVAHADPKPAVGHGSIVASVFDERQRYTVPEAARLLRVSRAHLYKLFSAGSIRTIRDGRRIFVPGSEIAARSAVAE